MNKLLLTITLLILHPLFCSLLLAQGGGNQHHAMHGKMKYAAVGDANNVWTVSMDERLLHWNGTVWDEPTEGRLTQVDVGADGAVWGVSSDGSIFRLNGTQWINVPGELSQIAVGNFSIVWGVNDADEIFRWNGTAFEKPFPTARMKQVDVSGDGSVWAVSANNKIFKLRGNTWELVPGSGLLTHVSVGGRSSVWGVNAEGQVFHYAMGTWQEPVPTARLTHIDVAMDGAMWGIDSENQVWSWDGTAWMEVKPSTRRETMTTLPTPVVNPNPGITVFQDANFSGASKTITADWDYSMDAQWNDRISSIRVPAGYKIQVFEHRYAGASMVLTSNWSITPGDMKFNDIISAVRILSYPQPPVPVVYVAPVVVAPALPPPPAPGGPNNPGYTIFEAVAFNGASAKLFGDWNADMALDWNDRISSIRIPAGYVIQVFENTNFKGASLNLTADWTVSNANIKFNDFISSIKVLAYPGIGYVAPAVALPVAPTPAGPTQGSNNPSYTIFADDGFHGASATLYGNWDVAMAPEWNDRISSIRVPPGYVVQVFEHANYQGAMMKLTADWSVSGPTGKFNDMISSIKVYPAIAKPGLNALPVVVEQPVLTVVNTEPVSTEYVVRALRTEYSSEESIVVEYSGFKGSGGEWVNVIPADKADDEWGNFQYTRGASGRLKFEDLNLKAGDYEVRAYQGGLDYTVKGRFKFRVQ